MIELVEDDFASFFEVPFEVYEGTPFVSHFRSDLAWLLDPRRNPALRDGGAIRTYVARRDGRPVGRICVHRQQVFNAFHGRNDAFFGFFDCEDEPGTAHALLRAAERWARGQGADRLIGNYNLTPNQQIGVLVGGYEHAPFVEHLYGPPHVAAYLAQAGFTPTADMATYHVDMPACRIDAMRNEKAVRVLADPEFSWTHFGRANPRARLDDFLYLFEQGFQDTEQYQPMSKEELAYQLPQLLALADPRLIFMVSHRGEPVGLCVCLPDVNPFFRATRSRWTPLTPLHYVRHRLRNRTAVVIFVAVVPAYRNAGVCRAMYYRLLSAVRDAGYAVFGSTWIGMANAASVSLLTKVGCVPRHRLAMFEKPLAARANDFAPIGE